MCSILVFVADVLGHKAFQMTFVEYNDMVEEIPTAVADESFGNTVLPRASEAGALRLDTEAPHRVDHFRREIRATVKDQMLRCGIVRKGLPQLLRHPGTRWMPGHIAVKNSPPVVRNDEKQ